MERAAHFQTPLSRSGLKKRVPRHDAVAHAVNSKRLEIDRELLYIGPKRWYTAVVANLCRPFRECLFSGVFGVAASFGRGSLPLRQSSQAKASPACRQEGRHDVSPRLQQNIENNPMQRSRRSPEPALCRYLTRGGWPRGPISRTVCSSQNPFRRPRAHNGGCSPGRQAKLGHH
jgi:hypothetical protein